MDYELFAYAFIAMSLGLMIGNLVGKRRMLFVPLLLSLLAVLVFLMKALDFENYNKLFGEIEKIDLYIAIYGAFVLLITFIYMICKRRKSKKLELV